MSQSAATNISEANTPDLEQAHAVVEAVVQNVQKVIQGKEPVIRQALACWLAGGHALIEDVPGTGKTVLAKAIARSVSVPNSRIQFTPDLLPSDIVGYPIYSKESGKFAFSPGPIFTSVLLADELNRATPRTQSALLEAMAEGQITSEKRTMKLPVNFFVVATQNPVEQHGTFPLPEAQLDRFMVRMAVGYPDAAAEASIIRAQMFAHPIESLKPIVDEAQWESARTLVRQVSVTDDIIKYALALVDATRNSPHLMVGASPRATIALIRLSQAYSLMYRLAYVKPDFVKYVASAVLTHRLLLTTKAKLEKVTAHHIVDQILNSVPVPVR